MPESFEANPDFIEARYVAGENQYDLELLAAAPEIVDFGSGGDSGGSLATSTALIQVTTRVLGGTRCPALDQYALARGPQGAIEPKLCGLLRAGRDFLFNPLTGNFNRVRRAEIVYAPTARVIGGGGGETVVSLSHPLIKTIAGAKKAVENMRAGDFAYMCSGAGRFVHPAAIACIEPAGLRACIEISLDDEFIYATAKRIDRCDGLFFLCHNLKDPDDEI